MWKGYEQQFGIDLGTVNTLIYQKGKGIVLQEPSVVAIHKDSRRIEAVGREAQMMIGRTPDHLQVIRPLQDGVIANFDMTANMLRHYIGRIQGHTKWLHRSRVVISVPCGITNVEKRAVEETVVHAGAKQAITIEEPLAAAMGAGLPVDEPIGSMVIDIGGGTTEVAVLSLGGIVVSQSVRAGGMAIDQAIIQYIKKEYNLEIGERTAEQRKISCGSAVMPAGEVDNTEVKTVMPAGDKKLSDNLNKGVDKQVYITEDEEVDKQLDTARDNVVDKQVDIAGDKAEDIQLGIMRHKARGKESDSVVFNGSDKVEVRGRYLVNGLPRTITVSPQEIYHTLQDFVQTIVEAIRFTLENCPPELAADIMERGILLSGGGSLLRGLDQRLQIETQIPVYLAESPLECVVLGTGKIFGPSPHPNQKMIGFLQEKVPSITSKVYKKFLNP